MFRKKKPKSDLEELGNITALSGAIMEMQFGAKRVLDVVRSLKGHYETSLRETGDDKYQTYQENTEGLYKCMKEVWEGLSKASSIIKDFKQITK